MPKRCSPGIRRTALEFVNQGQAQIEVAQALGVNPKTLSHWVTTTQVRMHEQQRNEIEELKRLRLQVRQQQAEIDFLNKQQRTLTSYPSEVRSLKDLFGQQTHRAQKNHQCSKGYRPAEDQYQRLLSVAKGPSIPPPQSASQRCKVAMSCALRYQSLRQAGSRSDAPVPCVASTGLERWY